jgi:hypothetical protein
VTDWLFPASLVIHDMTCASVLLGSALRRPHCFGCSSSFVRARNTVLRKQSEALSDCPIENSGPLECPTFSAVQRSLMNHHTRHIGRLKTIEVDDFWVK